MQHKPQGVLFGTATSHAILTCGVQSRNLLPCLQDPFNRESKLHSELANVSRVWPSVSNQSRMSELRQRSRASMTSSRAGSAVGGLDTVGPLPGGHHTNPATTMPSIIPEQFSKEVNV